MRLMRLTYVSKPVDGFGNKETFDDIVRVARERNLQDGITGILLANGKYFIQAIEGESVKLSACFMRIANDIRHENIELMEAVEANERHFSEWSMFFGDLNAVNPDITRRFARNSHFDPREMNALSLLVFLSAANATLPR